VAEKAIQTAKGHIIANIMGCDETFPMREWHKLLPQIELTMNMLRASNVRPNITAQNYVHAEFMITTKCPWPLWAAKLSVMQDRTNEHRLERIQWIPGILGHLQITTDVIQYS
jgi:hypothetical protein